MKVKDYSIGLDIGTSSIGWVVMDDQGKIRRVKGKMAIGTRLFQEGQSAAERRSFRTTRRRLNRRKWRLKLLEGIFDQYITPIDPNFFARMKESNLSPKDSRKPFKESMLFSDLTDQKYHEAYPTIYHLRNALMSEDKKFDIRMIYLAMHHIIKYRGNFLNSTPVDSFKSSNIGFKDQFVKLNDLYSNIDSEWPFTIDITKANQVGKLLLDTSARKLDKQRQTAKLIPAEIKDKTFDKIHRSIATEITKAILGYKAKIDVIVRAKVDDPKLWKIKFDDEDIDDELQKILPLMDDNQQSIAVIIQNLYSQVTLNQIVPNGMMLSQSMIQKYADHKAHLKLYKKLMNNITNSKKKSALKKAYADYVGDGEKKVIDQATFYADVKKNLDNSDESHQIQDLIDAETFMPKQRTSQNGVIPHQLHQRELDEIIENQSKYYPWLAEKNPNKRDRFKAKYKIDELVAFRIPYYVGPLITVEDQNKSGQNTFAWMVRKKGGQITPWNFENKIDRKESANRFIKRMTTKDSYLIGEDVLPDQSLLYEKFKVLNELNMLKVNDKRISVALKQDIYRDLFERYKNITVKKLQNYLKVHLSLPVLPQISGLSDSNRFNNNLGTYNDFTKLFGQKVDDPDLQDDFEKIVEWSTVFEDRKILQEKLDEIEWLTTKQKESIVTQRYTGWGRLSKKLLTEIVNSDGERIIDVLWNTNKNFMQIQTDEGFAKQIYEANATQVRSTNVEDVLADAYTSPQNKKAIRQVVKVVDDIQRAVGGVPPKFISIEFTRSEDRNPRRTISRQRQLEKMFKETAKRLVKAMNPELISELDKVSKGKRGLTDRLYLYFTQLGKDMYTGDPINIDEISNYDIDHILPQAFIKDDSLDNRVLVHKAVNNGKSDNVPIKLFGSKMRSFWDQLAENQLISKRKLKNLQTDPDTINKYTMHGFIHRQLVETSQVIKLVANILGEKYRNVNTKIIEIPAKMNHQMRDEFGFIKNREINDYHHAFDAYLTAFLGRYLYHRYIKLRPYFVYGDFKKFSENKVTMRNFNFLHDLADENQQRISDIETGEVIWDRNTSLKELRRVYHFKFMLVSQEVYTQRGAMFNRTIYRASEAKKRKLIPIKAGKNVDDYGGYSGSTDAYMAITRIHGKKNDIYRVVGVPTRALRRLTNAASKGHESYMNELKMVLTPKFTKEKKNRKTGEIIRIVENFDIVLGRVMYRQLVIEGDKKFMLGSSTYQYNAKQLVLSDKSVKTLAGRAKLDEKRESTDYDAVYDEILSKVDKYFSLYDKNSFRVGLRNGAEQFHRLPNHNQYEGNKKIHSGKREILNEILKGLHANPSSGKLKEIGISTPFGQIQGKNGTKLSGDALIVYQSPTGLFERRISLKDL
ncbi:type II CRISPR RNA-guided endonuclease Cas9 [Liquorilactobacillus sicerae]|uniref:type II CRISPR RNA-guided endonuclease Cas9 n=1 Tax=Liquorilactobacillus sicerae TaxID=1416943 RepID=UPI00247FDE8D|nr:type II CRISPR RNA-guided endonuclease Cas9 [Liquorilactobacillus sicerae]